MIDARFVPIEQWPGKPTPSHARKVDNFRATYNQTLDLLEAELRHLRAKEILIQAFFTRDQIRNDGWPKSGAGPAGPGVIVSFETPKGPLSFPCDRFRHFDGNLRAIALSLEALRAVDRYGVTQHAEQYQGWLRLPPPADRPFATKREAAVFLVTQVEGAEPEEDTIRIVTFDPAQRKDYYRLAAHGLHPDKPDGSHELFVRLQAAMKMLEGPG